MYGYIIDVLIWSFSIYGFISFMQEYLLETVCYIIFKLSYYAKKLKKYLTHKVDKKAE